MLLIYLSSNSPWAVIIKKPNLIQTLLSIQSKTDRLKMASFQLRIKLK